jgi:hypothetical protein
MIRQVRERQRERERERGKGEREKVENILRPGNNKGGSIIVPLTSCLTGLD